MAENGSVITMEQKSRGVERGQHETMDHRKISQAIRVTEDKKEVLSL